MPTTAPGAPTAVTASRGDSFALVTFSPPESDGGSPITLYTVVSSSGVHATGQSSPIMVGGLTNGTSCTFTVSATNAGGESPMSSKSTPITPATVPDAPAVLGATVGDTRSVVTFSAPEVDGGSPITGYTVTAVDLIVPGNGGQRGLGTASPITVENLINGEGYTFTVVATNDVGASPESAPSAMVIPAPEQVSTQQLTLPNAATFEINKNINQLQLQDELTAAFHVPVNTALSRHQAGQGSGDATLEIVPANLDAAAVQAVIDNHQPDVLYGVPEGIVIFNALVKKVSDNPDVMLSDQEIADGVKGLLLRSNNTAP